MSYTKTTWVNNSEPSINAANLNKMEQGIADAQFPDGGTVGQALVKTANGQAWADVISEGSIATVQGATASRNFSAGEYIVRNGVLYKVTTAVSSGATWGSGNTSQTSIATELGSTSLSGIGDGTVTGAVKNLDTRLTPKTLWTGTLAAGGSQVITGIGSATILALEFNFATETSNGRGRIIVHRTTGNAFYPACINGNLGWFRIEISGNTLEYISTSFEGECVKRVTQLL